MNITEVGDTFNCDCGFSWQRGFSGSHDCGVGLRKQIADLKTQPVSSECDRDVYENGKSACLVAIPKETAEVICRGISDVTGCKVDWHYIGGRVHIKALAAPPAVTGELLEAMDEVIRISDRDHDAWNRAKEAIATCRAAMLAAAPTQGEKQ